MVALGRRVRHHGMGDHGQLIVLPPRSAVLRDVSDGWSRPIRRCPHHRHGSNVFEPDVGVVAVHDGEESAPDYGRAASLISDNVQHDLGRSGDAAANRS